MALRDTSDHKTPVSFDLSVKRCRYHVNVTGHFWVDVAEQCHQPRIPKREGFRFALWPGAQIIWLWRFPVNVVADRIAVEEVDSGSSQHYD